MAHVDLFFAAVRLPFAVLTRLFPLLPLSTVLGLERFVVSNFEFSFVGLFAFRAAYCCCLLAAVFATYALGKCIGDVCEQAPRQPSAVRGLPTA
jgi:hypothetical protein